MPARDPSHPAVVRFAELEPRWTTSRATEPGHYRWLVSYLGGPAGHINPSPESGVTSDRLVVGVMGMPAGNRQHGFHTHTVAEIYVVLRGALRSIGPGTDHVAGVLDCIVIPAGVAHGVEAIGDEDALFLWIHDDLEPEGRAVYYEALEEAPAGSDEITLVTWASRGAVATAPEGGFVHAQRCWIEEPVVIESIEIAAANSEWPHVTTSTEVVVVIEGEVTLQGSNGAELQPLDALVLAPGAERRLAARALTAAQVIVVR